MYIVNQQQKKMHMSLEMSCVESYKKEFGIRTIWINSVTWSKCLNSYLFYIHLKTTWKLLSCSNFLQFTYVFLVYG